MNSYFFIYAILFLLCGTVTGSFLNVCIHQNPIEESLVQSCPHCTSYNSKFLKSGLILILSHIISGGKCRVCGTEISPRYPFVKFINGILYLISFIIFGLSAASILCCITISVLICLTFIDIDCRTVPDRFIIILFIIGIIDLCIHLGFIPNAETGITSAAPYERIIGFFAISVPMFIIGGITGGIGGGDVKLFAAGGFLLGWKHALLILLISSITASIFEIIIICVHKLKKPLNPEISENSKTCKTSETVKTGGEFEDLSQSERAIPFVPYISFGTITAIFFGSKIIEFYITMLTF